MKENKLIPQTKRSFKKVIQKAQRLMKVRMNLKTVLIPLLSHQYQEVSITL